MNLSFNIYLISLNNIDLDQIARKYLVMPITSFALQMLWSLLASKTYAMSMSNSFIFCW